MTNVVTIMAADSYGIFIILSIPTLFLNFLPSFFYLKMLLDNTSDRRRENANFYGFQNALIALLAGFLTFLVEIILFCTLFTGIEGAEIIKILVSMVLLIPFWILIAFILLHCSMAAHSYDSYVSEKERTNQDPLLPT